MLCEDKARVPSVLSIPKWCGLGLTEDLLHYFMQLAALSKLHCACSPTEVDAPHSICSDGFPNAQALGGKVGRAPGWGIGAVSMRFTDDATERLPQLGAQREAAINVSHRDQVRSQLFLIVYSRSVNVPAACASS